MTDWWYKAVNFGRNEAVGRRRKYLGYRVVVDARALRERERRRQLEWVGPRVGQGPYSKLPYHAQLT